MNPRCVGAAVPPAYRWSDEPMGPRLAPGAIVLSSFPSAGLAATVAAHYMIRTLNLARIATLESDAGLPFALVQGGQVQPPIRAYGRADLALVVSEFPPSMSSIAGVAQAILDGAEGRKARAILCLEGVVPHPASEDGEGEAEPPAEVVWAAAARRDAETAKLLEPGGVRYLEDGVIGGVSGALLVAGLRRRIPVAVLLVSARDSAGFPDHRAGAAMIETVDRILPEISIDTKPLRSQAEMIERALRSQLERQQVASEAASAGERGQTSMYQ
ncbi:MAG TPA: PAC2 family protein [Thermoplasmata archaeon]|nr:PAC2 family protein [Thermoplasmata archaeon]